MTFEFLKVCRPANPDWIELRVMYERGTFTDRHAKWVIINQKHPPPPQNKNNKNKVKCGDSILWPNIYVYVYCHSTDPNVRPLSMGIYQVRQRHIIERRNMWCITVWTINRLPYIWGVILPPPPSESWIPVKLVLHTKFVHRSLYCSHTNLIPI
jgi:hypothetical protein